MENEKFVNSCFVIVSDHAPLIVITIMAPDIRVPYQTNHNNKSGKNLNMIYFHYYLIWEIAGTNYSKMCILQICINYMLGLFVYFCLFLH